MIKHALCAADLDDMSSVADAPDTSRDDVWMRLAVAFRRPAHVRGLDDPTTIRLVVPLALGIWTVGVGAFALALAREGLLDAGRVMIYATLGPFLTLAVPTARRTDMLPGFLGVSVILWLACLSVTTPFYYFAGGIIGTALTACLASWFGTWRGIGFACITTVGQLAGGLHFGDEFVFDRVILLLLSMVFVVVIAGGVADRVEAAVIERDLLLVELNHLSRRDQLTGLANRRAFEEAMAERLARSDHQFSIALFDIDEFKQINDTAGHHEGDLVLRAVGERLQLAFPDALVARLGGDEFVMVVDDCGVDQDLASGARAAFELPLSVDDGRLRTIGVSVGTAARAPHLDCTSSLLTLADERLYAMKRNQRSVSTPQSATEPLSGIAS